jgi:hypothetical protein
MEWLYPIALRVIAAVALIYFGLGLFNVNWLLRIRILCSLSIGALLVGALGWPLVRPDDPLGAISLITGELTPVQAGILILLGFLSGVAATLACYPLGSVLAPFAAPAGIAALALNSGTMRQILLTGAAFEQRNVMYASMRWELLFWLGVCAAGHLGVWLTSRFLHTKTINPLPETSNKITLWTNWAVAFVAAAVIVYLTIGIFAQDLRQPDETLGYVVGQPGHRQAAFGVFVSVGLAAFVVRYFVGTHYIPVVLGAAALYIGAFTKIINSQILEHIVRTWPIDFFSHTIYAILPIQYASFSVLGGLTGYWISFQLKHKSDTSQPSDKA